MPAGGLRRGAGRKPKEVTELTRRAKRNFADLILSDKDEEAKWKEVLKSKSEKIVLDALKSLSEFKHGKAKQSLEIDGTLDLVARVDVNV